MNPTECPRCGQPMPGPGVCPVCEYVYESPAPPVVVSPWVTRWRSGQLPVALAGVLIALGVFPSLLRDVRSVQGSVSVSLYDLLQGRYPVVGRFAAWLVVGSVVFLGSMLSSRRTGSAMSASRPVLLVVSLTPLVGAALPFMRLHRYGQDPGIGPAALFLAAGVAMALMGALRFGTGVADPPLRGQMTDDDD